MINNEDILADLSTIDKNKKHKLKDILTHKIIRNPENPRIIFRPEELESLLYSISKIGIQVPLTVYQDGNQYVLIDGERRWKCAKKLNLKTVPALIQKKPTRLHNLLFMFNIHALREQWDILTISIKLPAIMKLLEEKGVKTTERELAKYTGLTQGIIRRSKLLMKLPEKYKNIILKELEKSKSKQKLTEDFFIEMERGIRTVKRHLPGVIKNTNKVREVLIKKYKNDIITNIVDFRDVSRIARSKNVGVPSVKARRAISTLFKDNDYSIGDAFRDSAEWAYDEKDILNRLEWLLENLPSLKGEVPESDEIMEMLLKLQTEISRFLEENR